MRVLGGPNLAQHFFFEGGGLHKVLPGKEEVGDRGQHGDGPAQGGHQHRPPQLGEGEHVEGPADGKEPLQGEGQDSQHVCIRCATM